MLLTLLAKDWARIRANPGPYLAMLALPFALTALIGMAFAPSNDGNPQLPAIKVAITDEDGGIMGEMVQNALTQASVEILTEAVAFEEADKRMQDGEFSAVINIPAGFSQAFFAGEDIPPLTLVKNPTQRFYPAIVEEVIRFLAEILDAIVWNLAGAEELEAVRSSLKENQVPDPDLMDTFVQTAYARMGDAEHYFFPPLIETEHEHRTEEPDASTDLNLFGFLLPGLAALFLLFLADIGIRGLFDENRLHTLQRFRTLHINTFPLVLSKALLAMTVVLAGGIILLGFGGLAFRVQWQHPWAIAMLTLSYSIYAAGLLAALAAWVGTEKRANVVNTVVIFAAGFMGGSMLPVDSLPEGITANITPYMPTYWFSGAITALEFGVDGPPWQSTTVKMLVIGAVLILIATRLINRRLAKGVR